MGRPSSYTPETGITICERLEQGESLLAICRDEDMPDTATVMRWVRAHEDFRVEYTRARAESGHACADQVQDIAGRVAAGEMDPSAGRVAADVLKWCAGRRKPKVYGDRLEVAGDKDQPLHVTVRQF